MLNSEENDLCYRLFCQISSTFIATISNIAIDLQKVYAALQLNGPNMMALNQRQEIYI